MKDYITEKTLLIGCDGGANHMVKLGYKPDVIIGDFDSVDKRLLKRKGIEFIRYPEDKDYTDSELAMEYAAKKGVKQIVIFGLSGFRIDHMIGNVFLLKNHKFLNTEIKIIEGRQEIYLVYGSVKITGKKGETTSFIPMFGDVRAESSNGLKYDLSKYNLSMQGNTGISNELTADKAEIALGDQYLLVVHRRG